MSKPRRFYRDVDGILLLDKPLGLSSNAALQQARTLFSASKAGHAGSLDPLASGLLPICFGQATKVCGRLLDAGKTYLVDVHLGARTESLDGETEVIETAPVPPLDETTVDATLATFLGEQDQVPPMHSALKHQGKRLYELARRGESVERPPRRIRIDRIQRRRLAADRLEFEVACSKGTYIRSLAADIAARLGTLGYLVGLRRLSVEPFESFPMYRIDELQARQDQAGQAGLDELLLSADVAFGELGAVRLGDPETRILLLGQPVPVDGPVQPGASLRAYDPGGRFLALVEGAPDGRVRPVRLFVPVQEGDAPQTGPGDAN
ncbi:MAG TPA: tRNA pseudouridine(55) synthase TruB [Povalibacter sp.]|uniref:tRNA pseudouridine(55) synthase TruB n=1 Tax=Povalibacter sp. TaxID=1962978 RepID=UPI002CE1E6CB|nr:tRNA pseudouridine(55) synthase TruB [Povalibacter sp.]HMN45721.1 tRNA pseudouridine(55) synthase TruB [Povalibacter sp.]